MSTKKTTDDVLFQPDRRKELREDSDERRFFRRPSTYLKILGATVAILVALALCALFYSMYSA